MKKVLSLGRDLWLVEGTVRWAIYDLEKNIIVQITRQTGNFLAKIIKLSRSIQDKITILQKEAPQIYEAILIESSAERLFDRPIDQVFTFPNYMIWVEITDACNQECLHCYTRSIVRGNFLDQGALKKLITQASQLKFEQIQFTGGEPFLYPNLWYFIDCVRELDSIPLIEIYSNLTLITDKDIDLMKKYRIKIATTLLGSCSEVHDRCTTIRGSFSNFIRNIRKVRDAGIEFRVGVVRMPENQDDMVYIEALMREEGFVSQEKSCVPDDVRPVGRGEEYPISISEQSSGLYLHIDRKFFNMARQWNTCWGGELAVTSKGDVLPCIFARDQIMGNVHCQDLQKIIRGQVKKHWSITSGKIDKCRDCEYRFACTDCRVLSLKAGKGFYGEPQRCNYDPYN
ncbi:radical SAM protein [Patescibacteria group bacterium]|nr:radical SAM protein [Patescibacteria group bacterium]